MFDSIKNTKAHRAYVKMAFPDESNDASSPKVWFCVLNGKDDFMLHVNKKVGGKPATYKSPKAITKVIDKHGAPKGFTVDKKSKIVAGTIWVQEGKVHIHVAVKAQGGNIKTITQALKKKGAAKMGFPKFNEVEIVRQLDDDEQAAEAKVQEAKGKNKKLDEKLIRLHARIQQSLGKIGDRTEFEPGQLQALENLVRRLTKYLDKKGWKTLSKKDYQQAGVGEPLSERDTTSRLSTLSEALDRLRTAAAEQDDQEAERDLKDDLQDGGARVQAAIDYATTIMGMTKNKTINPFVKALVKYFDVFDVVKKDFTADEIKALMQNKYFGNKDWTQTFEMFSMFR